jgi:pimeloyl-ACP methyl ester carboxylesterase
MATGLIGRVRAKQAEDAHPPLGRFVEVDGVRLHYIECGAGEPLVIFHGNGSMAEEFILSGFVTLAAQHFRVIVFDRPGYGYSERPHSKVVRRQHS